MQGFVGAYAGAWENHGESNSSALVGLLESPTDSIIVPNGQ